jgi:hypothetical protein
MLWSKRGDVKCFSRPLTFTGEQTNILSSIQQHFFPDGRIFLTKQKRCPPSGRAALCRKSIVLVEASAQIRDGLPGCLGTQVR